MLILEVPQAIALRFCFHVRSLTCVFNYDPANSCLLVYIVCVIYIARMAPSRAERLAQLRALRANGKTNFEAYEVEEAQSIYETVDDEAYKKVVRSRLDQDDFVVDDNGQGYADDGREDWQDEGRVYEDSGSEEDLPKNGKAGE